MPRPIIYVLLVLVAASLIPVGLMYKSRQSVKTSTRVQVMHDMDSQDYTKAQTKNAFFADGMGMRHHPEGTVARGLLREDPVFFRGRVSDGTRDTSYTEAFPVTVTRYLLDRGQERFESYCVPCHCSSGNGQGIVHQRATALAEGTWTPPTDLASQTVVDRPTGHIYNTITNGIRNMPAYGPQIEPADRWAITAYVRALQLSRNATIADVSAEERAALIAQRDATEAAAEAAAEAQPETPNSAQNQGD